MNVDNIKSSYLLKPSQFDPIALVWSVFKGEAKITRIILSRLGLSAEMQKSTLFSGAIPGSCQEIDAIAKKIEAFFSGEDIKFPLNMVRMDLCTEFQKKVLIAEHAIPRGKISTYSCIAQGVGNPRGARVVGNALANNPFPIIIPCHRAIRSDGSLGGYQGGLEMKRKLLEMEGIKFDRKGKILKEDFLFELF